MPLITPASLATNIYAEIITEITRGNDTITTLAIDAAIQEAKMYLSRYDLLQLFGDDTTPPAIHDEYLEKLVKDLACWHLLRLSPAGLDDAAYRRCYEDAISTLKNIMSGQLEPQGWPYQETAAQNPPPGDSISWNSNPKRHNYY